MEFATVRRGRFAGKRVQVLDRKIVPGSVEVKVLLDGQYEIWFRHSELRF